MVEFREIGNFIGKKILGIAEFFGDANIAQAQARALNYSPEQVTESLKRAHLAAATRSSLFWGDDQRVIFHLDQFQQLGSSLPSKPESQTE